MDKKVLDDIVAFIDKYFVNGNKKQSIINISILIKYLSTVDTSDFDYDCFCYILKESSKINSLIDFIIKSEDRDFYMRDFFISNIVYTYVSENELDIDLDSEIKESNIINVSDLFDYDDDPIDTKTNSLDLIKLYKRDIKDAVPFTQEEEIEIFKRYKKATGRLKEQIKNEIIFHNLRYVFNLAYKKQIGINIPLGDLIQEGSIGLMKAVERFDLSKECKFSTYARSWIIQSMNVAIAEQLRNITGYGNEQLVKIYRVIEEYRSMYGEAPDEYYIANILNMNVSRVQELLLMSNIISLNKRISADNDIEQHELQDFVAVEEEDNGIFGSLAARIDFKDAVLSSPYLTDKEKKVIDLRYGLSLGRMDTLENIGKILNISRQRVFLLEKKSIKKLMKDPRVRTYNPRTENN